MAIGGTALAIGSADAPAASGDTPTMAHLMAGDLKRLVAIIGKKIEYGVKAPGEPGKTQDRITADVLVIDGGPFTFGGKPLQRPPVADTMVVQQLPYLALNMWISNKVLITQLERKVGQGIAVGRLYYGEPTNGNNAPYKITEDPTPEEIEFVTRWWAAYQAKQWTSPAAIPIGAPQPGQNLTFQQAPQFGQQPAMAMGGQAAPVQNPASPNPTMPFTADGQPFNGYPPQSAQFTAPAQPAAPVNFQAFMSPAAPAAPVQEIDWTLTTMPPTVPAEHLQAWQTQTTKDQRLQMLAAAGIDKPPAQATQQPTGL